MNTFFNIHYEFDKQRVHTSIARQLEKLGSDYICVVDGVVLGTANRKSDYLRTVNGGMFSICDSSYVPLYIHWIYGKRYEQYCGSQIFMDIIHSRKYRMIFLGTSRAILRGLQSNLSKENPDVADMTFLELPYMSVEELIENRHLEDQILEVRVPMEDVEEMKNGQKKLVQKKMFPGYVLINMVMNDDTWYVVRNTRGVTGFVGPGSKPVPLTEEEMDRLGIQNVTLQIDFEEGDSVVVTGGVWKDTVGVVQSINEAKQIVTINVELFGRETPVEISFAEVKKM